MSRSRDFPGPTEVHVWHVPLSIPVRPSLLSEDERLRADRFRFDRDRDRFVACRSALRQILGDYLHQPADRLVFGYGRSGKPTLAGADLRFNISHSSDHALIAVAFGREVGIDVECPGMRINAAEIAARFLTLSEAAFVRSAPPEPQDAAFLACWTRKEAWAKAVGTGLSEDLGRFDVSQSLHRTAQVLIDPMTGLEWLITELPTEFSAVAALAVEGRELSLSYELLD